MSKPEISVVVPTYNEEKYLRECLKSLLAQDFAANFEIIIVDSSTDVTWEIAKKFGAKVVRFPKSTPAEARQAGFAASSGEIIATIDADNQAPKNWLSQIKKEFENAQTVCLFGAISSLEGKFLDNVLLFFYNLANWASLQVLGFTILTGTNQAIRREVFAKIGGFEPLKLPNTHCDIFDQKFLFERLAKIGKIKFSFALQIKFSMRRFHKNGYLTTFWWGTRQWLALHVWSGFGFPKLEPLKFSKKAAVVVFITSFAIISALVLNFSLNLAEAEFHPKIVREKFAQQVSSIKAKAEPWVEKVENFEVKQIFR